MEINAADLIKVKTTLETELRELSALENHKGISTELITELRELKRAREVLLLLLLQKLNSTTFDLPIPEGYCS
ncbi:MAG: hypothetical protein HS115_11615 [Spirochaetales bacterium]|nr:hypothetical protein [Spirochaetales bacterium]